VHLIYLDDSGDDNGYQIIVAVIIPDEEFMEIEGYLGYVIEQNIPEEMRDSFEFHASNLFQSNPPFEKIKHQDAIEILTRCAEMLKASSSVIIYGAVDVKKLRSSIHASASPADVAFRICLPEIRHWFDEHARDKLGILIMDDTENKPLKKEFQKSFHANRSKIRVKSQRIENEFRVEESRGTLPQLHDDMYFGDSSYSVGIQLADICAFIISRHLKNKPDTEFLYKIIEANIFCGKVDPE
jgi:Protein of unknown function (DUF3800)